MSVFIERFSFCGRVICLQKSRTVSANLTICRGWWAQWWAHLFLRDGWGGARPARESLSVAGGGDELERNEDGRHGRRPSVLDGDHAAERDSSPEVPSSIAALPIGHASPMKRSCLGVKSCTTRSSSRLAA